MLNTMRRMLPGIDVCSPPIRREKDGVSPALHGGSHDRSAAKTTTESRTSAKTTRGKGEKRKVGVRSEALVQENEQVPRNASTSKKRIWKETDPLEFPPHEYHRSLFKCNQPFVTISTEIPSYNMFGRLQMRHDTRKAAIQFLLKPANQIFRSYEHGRGELDARELHSALFRNLWRLTKPSRSLLDRIDSMEEAYEIKYCKKRQRISVQINEDENTDLVIGDMEEEPKLGSFGSKNSNESLKIEEEVKPEDGENTGRGRLDMKLFVYNSSNKKLKKLFKETDDVEPCKSVLIVECKSSARNGNAIYQAACYACQEAWNNMSNLHFDPIYLLVLTESEWTYGILDFRGCIDVMEGQVDMNSFATFTIQEGVRFSNNPIPMEALEDQLAARTVYYRRRFSKCPNAMYPSKAYLVGTLYIANNWSRLPLFDTLGGAAQAGVFHFYEGLLRIVIGDKVLSWEIDDLKKAIMLKDTVLKAEEELMWS